MLSEDRFFEGRDLAKAWERYCGFLDLSLDEFMGIQNHLLMEEVEVVHGSQLGQRLVGMDERPQTLDEFRKRVPLTSYEDYAPFIGERQEDVLAQPPAYWTHTSGRGGKFKWIPYTERADEVFCRNIISMAILGLASKRGEVGLRPGVKVLSNLPERPYISGCLAFNIAKRFTWFNIPPLDLAEKMEFQERIERGFKIALRDEVDLVISMSSVLIKIGDLFSEGTQRMKFAPFMMHPRILSRLGRAKLASRREKRAMLPKDLWNIKGVISWGTDIGIYKEKIKQCWGKEPLEFYAFAEAGLIALQSWNKKGMTFLPHTAFYEFIPEAEWLKCREDRSYKPGTVLMDELKPGGVYELVVTNFYGMPFLRYRVGDLVKIVALRDEEAGVNLPQMVFQSRADGIVDIGGFTRLDEKVIWQAIANTHIKYVDWTARKETENGDSVLRLYIELYEQVHPKKLEEMVHEQLKLMDRDYSNLETMLNMRPLRVTLLPKGAFQRFYNSKRLAGYDLAHLKPPHINAHQATIDELSQAGFTAGLKAQG
ncbi:MAG: GH3 auxin-responsive promoter family protein [Chloroflexi bacterium]|nr:GH3 auxin-responsive promoter family protein [Chloroflexota bacterium]